MKPQFLAKTHRFSSLFVRNAIVAVAILSSLHSFESQAQMPPMNFFSVTSAPAANQIPSTTLVTFRGTKNAGTGANVILTWIRFQSIPDFPYFSFDSGTNNIKTGIDNTTNWTTDPIVLQPNATYSWSAGPYDNSGSLGTVANGTFSTGP